MREEGEAEEEYRDNRSVPAAYQYACADNLHPTAVVMSFASLKVLCYGEFNESIWGVGILYIGQSAVRANIAPFQPWL